MKFYKRLSNIFLFLILLTAVIFSQPIGNYNVKLVDEHIIESPDQFKACHSSTIVELSPSSIIAAWFGGSHEGANDVGIWMSKFSNDKWSAPIEVVKGYDSEGNQLPCWNPVLYKMSNNKLVLFYKVGPNPREWWGLYVTSTDNGTTWSKPYDLPKGFLGPIKNKLIQLDNGLLLSPSSIETHDDKWITHLEVCNADLTNWRKIEIPKDDSVGVIQPTIIEHKNGDLQMLCRSRQNKIYSTFSSNHGETWTKLSPIDLPNPNSGIDAATLNDGRFIMVYNPLLKGEDWWNGRNVLNVAISNDGNNWEDIYQLEKTMDGEYSYPAVIQTDKGKIHITYTYLRKKIKHIILQL